MMLAQSSFVRGKCVSPSSYEQGPLPGLIGIDQSLLDQNSNWIGMLNGLVPAIHLLEANDVSITNLAHWFNSDGKLFADCRMVPSHVVKYLDNNQDIISTGVSHLEKIEYNRSVFFFGTTKNVFGHWLLEMIPAAIIYKTFYAGDEIPFVIWDETWPIYIDFLTTCLSIKESLIMRVPLSKALIKFKHVYSVELFHCDYLFNSYFSHFIAYLLQPTFIPLLRQDRSLMSRIFVSRSSFNDKATRPADYVNMHEVEELMHTEFDFTIVHPETMSIRDQITLFASSSYVCGIGGSGLHSSIFMPAGGTVISLDFNRVQLKLSILLRQSVQFVIQNRSMSAMRHAQEKIDISALRSIVKNALPS